MSEDIIEYWANKKAEQALLFSKEELIKHSEYIKTYLPDELKNQAESMVKCIDAVIRFYPEDFQTLSKAIAKEAKRIKEDELRKGKPISIRMAVELAAHDVDVYEVENQIIRSALLEALDFCNIEYKKWR